MAFTRLVLAMPLGEALILDFETAGQARAAFIEIYRGDPHAPTKIVDRAEVPADVRSASLEEPPELGSGLHAILSEAERVLLKHSPATFGTRLDADAYPECIEDVRGVEDLGAWKGAYESIDAFYAAHEERHPKIRQYGDARRERQSWRSVRDG